MNNKSILGAAAALVAAIVIGGIWIMNRNDDSTTGTTGTVASTTPTPQADIVSVASNTTSLSTLVTAVKAADLVATLQGSGPFTVFAPTNDAFAALPSGTFDTLLKPENKTQLASILTYHVVAGKIMAADLKDGQKVTTVQGNTLTVELMDGKVYLNDAAGGQATVSQADISAANGVVHVINKVVLPQ